MKFLNQLLLISLMLTASIAAKAQTLIGGRSSAVLFRVNGQPEFYNTSGRGTNVISSDGPFAGDLGTFDQNSHDLILDGPQLRTFKNDDGSICNPHFFYNIHKQGQPGTYIDERLEYLAPCGANGTYNNTGNFGGGTCSMRDQKWGDETIDADLTEMCPGEYVIDVYYEIRGATSSTEAACSEVRNIGRPTAPIGSMTFTIVGPPIMATAMAGDPVCEGTPVSLTSSVSGGNAPYTYSWTGPDSFSSMASSPAVTAPGTYTLTVTDNCGTTTTVQTTVTFRPTPASPLVTATATECPAGTATLTATGCDNGTITWSDGVSSTPTIGSPIVAGPGTYTTLSAASNSACTNAAMPCYI